MSSFRPSHRPLLSSLRFLCSISSFGTSLTGLDEGWAADHRRDQAAAVVGVQEEVAMMMLADPLRRHIPNNPLDPPLIRPALRRTLKILALGPMVVVRPDSTPGFGLV